ncbi:hypothetical protein FHX76_001723 [Lysinibacter cavernae]|uniref:Uncharacterized protein n=1 Tax=Lysinibacter cavernae TaxID=1640652 RepID=A0A7X5R1V5_9MICO|nr:hypothetical protein [Lysinibacter cavernae]
MAKRVLFVDGLIELTDSPQGWFIPLYISRCFFGELFTRFIGYCFTLEATCLGEELGIFDETRGQFRKLSNNFEQFV